MGSVGVACSGVGGVWQLCVCRSEYSADLDLKQSAWTTTPKTTKQNLIVCTGKSKAAITNNKRLRSRY